MDIENPRRSGSYPTPSPAPTPKDRLRVAASLPLRVYLERTPLSRGRGFVMWKLLRPLLPPRPVSFVAGLPDGLRLRVQYRELLGLEMLTGGFESAEADALVRAVAPGSVAIDAGANVGFHTVVLARAVGADGHVWAYEPMESTAERLRSNVALNDLKNVDVRVAAVTDHEGVVSLEVSDDDAVHSTVAIHISQATSIGRRDVAAVTLDDEWRRAGSPRVSVAKIDVEGAELEVLRGAESLLEACRPALLVEAPTHDHEDRLRAWLEPRGYAVSRPAGFKAWNVFAVSAAAG